MWMFTLLRWWIQLEVKFKKGKKFEDSPAILYPTSELLKKIEELEKRILLLEKKK